MKKAANWKVTRTMKVMREKLGGKDQFLTDLDRPVQICDVTGFLTWQHKDTREKGAFHVQCNGTKCQCRKNREKFYQQAYGNLARKKHYELRTRRAENGGAHTTKKNTSSRASDHETRQFLDSQEIASGASSLELELNKLGYEKHWRNGRVIRRENGKFVSLKS